MTHCFVDLAPFTTRGRWNASGRQRCSPRPRHAPPRPAPFTATGRKGPPGRPSPSFVGSDKSGACEPSGLDARAGTPDARFARATAIARAASTSKPRTPVARQRRFVMPSKEWTAASPLAARCSWSRWESSSWWWAAARWCSTSGSAEQAAAGRSRRRRCPGAGCGEPRSAVRRARRSRGDASGTAFPSVSSEHTAC